MYVLTYGKQKFSKICYFGDLISCPMDHHVKHQHKIANYVYKTWQKIEGAVELF